MTNDRESVSLETTLYVLAAYIRAGVRSLRRPKQLVAAALYLTAAFAVRQFYAAQSALVQVTFDLAAPLFFAAGTVTLLYLLGRPLGARRIHNAFFQSGVRNAASEAPFLLEQTKRADGSILKLYAPGITIPMVQERQAELEAALNA